MNDRDWIDVSLGDIATLEYGAALPANVRGGDAIPVFGSNGEVGRHRVALVDGPGIIVGRKGSVGAITWSESDFWPIDTTYYVKNRPGVDLRWLYWMMGTLGLERLDSSTGVPGLNRNDAYERRLLLPPRAQQLKVVEMLDAVSTQIRSSRRVQDKLERIRLGLLDESINALGEQNLVPLSELCSADICYGIVQSGAFVPGGIPVLAIRDLGGDFVSGVHRTSASVDGQYRRSRVAPGDVLLSIKGTIGRVGVAPEHYVGNISREIGRLRFTRRVDPQFARQYFLSRRAQTRLDLAVVGTTRAEISIHVLKKFGFPVPDPEVQKAVVSRMAIVEERIASEARVVAKLRAIQMGLTESLVGGRNRLNVEVAS